MKVNFEILLVILLLGLFFPKSSVNANYALVEGKDYEFALNSYTVTIDGLQSNIITLEDFEKHTIEVKQGESFVVVPLNVEDRPNIPVDVDGLQIQIKHGDEILKLYSPISGYDYFVDRQWNELTEFHVEYNSTEATDFGFIQKYKEVIQNETVFGFIEQYHEEQRYHPTENFTESRYFETYFLKSSGVMIIQIDIYFYDGEFTESVQREYHQYSYSKTLLGESIPTTQEEEDETTEFKIFGFTFFWVFQISLLPLLNKLKLKYHS